MFRPKTFMRLKMQTQPKIKNQHVIFSNLKFKLFLFLIKLKKIYFLIISILLIHKHKKLQINLGNKIQKIANKDQINKKM